MFDYNNSGPEDLLIRVLGLSRIIIKNVDVEERFLVASGTRILIGLRYSRVEEDLVRVRKIYALIFIEETRETSIGEIEIRLIFNYWLNDLDSLSSQVDTPLVYGWEVLSGVFKLKMKKMLIMVGDKM